jgi:Tfp pilus assembly protein FimT
MKCAGVRNQTSDIGRLALRKRRGGFTLYEIVIVLIVIIAVSSIVVPSVAGFLPSIRVRKAGDELIATFSKARTDAVLTSRRFRIVFTKEPPAYRLEYEPDPMNEPATFRRFSGDWGTKAPLPEGVIFAALEGAETDASTSEEFLEFSPDGTAPQAKVVLSHESGDQVTIEIDPSDGRARVVEPDEVNP